MVPGQKARITRSIQSQTTTQVGPPERNEPAPFDAGSHASPLIVGDRAGLSLEGLDLAAHRVDDPHAAHGIAVDHERPGEGKDDEQIGERRFGLGLEGVTDAGQSPLIDGVLRIEAPEVFEGEHRFADGVQFGHDVTSPLRNHDAEELDAIFH